MSAITGFGSYHNKVESRWIHRMTGELAHRGPDDEGYLAIDADRRNAIPLTGPDSKVEGKSIENYREPVDFYLGSRRLAILDPTPLGHQPMCAKHGNLWIVFSGRIYNYIELRAQLKENGYTFNSTSDTEVLLTAYEKWGERCLDRLDGMWSFVIYDRRRGRLFGARDRFGIQPFYLFKDESYFAFASEIKALLTLPVLKKELNTQALFDFLAMDAPPFSAESFFKGITELKSSCAFSYVIKNGRYKQWQYATIDYTEKKDKFNQQKCRRYVLDLKQLITRAVKLRLRADVPLGSVLNGGLDSSAIAATISRLMNIEAMDGMPSALLSNGYRQRVFTAAFPGSPHDPDQWTKLAEDKFHARWFRTFPKANEFLEDIEDLAYTQDIPYGTPAVYAQYRVMKLAGENGVKVLLNGQGADELFGGLAMHHEAFFMQLLKQFKAGRILREWYSLQHSPLGNQALISALYRQFRDRFLPSSIVRNQRSNRNHRPHYLYMTSEFWEANRERFRQILPRDFPSLNAMLAEYFTYRKRLNPLKYEDRNAMRFSVESRSPFADSMELTGYVFHIPWIYKIRNGYSKYLLRETMAGILPKEILLAKGNPDNYFPSRQWLEILAKNLGQYLTDDIKDYVNVPMLKLHLEKGMKGASPELLQTMWKVISFAVWKKVFKI